MLPPDILMGSHGQSDESHSLVRNDSEMLSSVAEVFGLQDSDGASSISIPPALPPRSNRTDQAVVLGIYTQVNTNVKITLPMGTTLPRLFNACRLLNFLVGIWDAE